jgi:hypothetical protein
MIERRKHPRINIHCQVFFECSDAPGQNISQDMAMALDISEKGMLLETSAPIHASTIKVIVPVKEEESVEVMGNIIYSIPMPEDGYHTGIIFHEAGNDITRLVATLCAKQ